MEESAAIQTVEKLKFAIFRIENVVYLNCLPVVGRKIGPHCVQVLLDLQIVIVPHPVLQEVVAVGV